MLGIWQFNSSCIRVFLSMAFAMLVTLILISFIALIFNMSIKIASIIGRTINFLIHIFIVFYVLLRIFYFLKLNGSFSLAIMLFLCVFVIILHVSCLSFTNCNDCNSLSSSFFHIHISIDRNVDHPQCNNNDSLV